MKKLLFLIHDLQGGGAEKVLVNLVNNMDHSKFDVTVMTLFDVGVNRQYLSDKVHYKFVYKKMMRGNSHFMKLLTPEQLHKKYIKDTYDFEVAYLEGPCARIISGCPDPNTKLVSWIHVEQHTPQSAAGSFRSIDEAERCYRRFDKVVCVSDTVKQDFESIVSLDKPPIVLYNTNESEKILALSCLSGSLQPRVRGESPSSQGSGPCNGYGRKADPGRPGLRRISCGIDGCGGKLQFSPDSGSLLCIYQHPLGLRNPPAPGTAGFL